MSELKKVVYKIFKTYKIDIKAYGARVRTHNKKNLLSSLYSLENYRKMTQVFMFSDKLAKKYKKIK